MLLLQAEPLQPSGNSTTRWPRSSTGVQCEVMATSDERTTPEQSQLDGETLERTRDERGVDITLIFELLQLEPVERMRLNDRAANAVLELRDAFAAKP